MSAPQRVISTSRGTYGAAYYGGEHCHLCGADRAPGNVRVNLAGSWCVVCVVCRQRIINALQNPDGAPANPDNDKGGR